MTDLIDIPGVGKVREGQLVRIGKLLKEWKSENSGLTFSFWLVGRIMELENGTIQSGPIQSMTFKPGSNQVDKVLQILQGGFSLTAFGAVRNYKIYRLASCIHKLTRKGYKIESKLMPTSCGRSHYSVYWMDGS